MLIVNANVIRLHTLEIHHRIIEYTDLFLINQWHVKYDTFVLRMSLLLKISGNNSLAKLMEESKKFNRNEMLKNLIGFCNFK